MLEEIGLCTLQPKNLGCGNSGSLTFRRTAWSDALESTPSGRSPTHVLAYGCQSRSHPSSSLSPSPSPSSSLVISFYLSIQPSLRNPQCELQALELPDGLHHNFWFEHTGSTIIKDPESACQDRFQITSSRAP